MAVVKPFLCIRPTKELVSQVAALPYDVYNREEAVEAVKGNSYSFLNIDRPETQFPMTQDMYSDVVYDKARKVFEQMLSDGIFIKDNQKAYYVYQLTMNGRSQTGLVACASIDDYMNNVIKKHENTREEKEQDRIHHVDTLNAQTGPIFLAYRAQKAIDNIVDMTIKEEPLYSFVSEDEVAHKVWRISTQIEVNAIEEGFQKISQIYIADGHHRAASAVKVGLKRRKENPNYNGTEEFNYFLSVLFPHDQLYIMPYNRVLKNTKKCSVEELLKQLSQRFHVTKMKQAYQPEKKGLFGMYIEHSWYELSPLFEVRKDDPVRQLDVSILQEEVLTPIFGIEDPRTDERIDFVGGIRGLEELERRANSDMEIAFSMYPTTIEELFEVADASKLMPPKSTWFEPKLRSGIFIHSLA